MRHHFSPPIILLVIAAFVIGIITLLPPLFHVAEDVAPSSGGQESFTVAVIPDTQQYAELEPDLFYAQTRWILGTKQQMNTVFAIHVGDVVQTNAKTEWEIADIAFRMLDGAVPYLIAIGNHDLGKRGTADSRDTSRFNAVFGPQRFAGRSWYGGHYGETNDNAYAFFRAGGMDFMVLALEFGPRDEVLTWANDIVSAHRHRRVIVVTHAYLGPEPRRTSDEYRVHNATNYECCKNDNDGEEIWQKFIRKHPNIFMVVSGHEFKPQQDGVYPPVIGYASSIGDAGNTVYEFAVNYQTVGYGLFRVLRFEPKANRIVVEPDTPLRTGEFTDAYDHLTQRGYFDSWDPSTPGQPAGHSFVLPYDMTLR